ncbi:uncharacterized protein UTRI_02239 [Ustilago trichophora]|uniref:Zn(2)-C6 fungal-type domain-containing protein n=1 Tax=Ustilago trichophora TaxID=86804 RepID=A0A5C3E0Q8_9BASI|nr:uncharacterized protein UTRI_02239 [Ustilago trichophora]
MSPDHKDDVRPSTVPRKRPLARRSCLKCREKKARCELPDVYVDSSKIPLPTDKQCHRCNVLGIDCIVWDGDRKRKPKLDRHDDPTPTGSVERDSIPFPDRGDTSASSSRRSSQRARLEDDTTSQSKAASTPVINSDQVRRLPVPSQNADGEQLAASDLSRAQNLLINRQMGWKTMFRTLNTLVERLQREHKYSNYLRLRIEAPPSTPDIVTFLPSERMDQLDLQLRDYLVGHPYLPSLANLHRQQTQSSTRPRALLLATMTLLGLKEIEDELSSADIRNLSFYVDRLGTQMLLSSPRDIHLVMAFELLLAHEPGLVGTAASQFEPEGRGFGLASENLLTCAIKIAKELGIDELVASPNHSASRLTRFSLWCCLETWQALYAFFGKGRPMLDSSNAQHAADVRSILDNVDDEGKPIPPAPRLKDTDGPTATSHRQMRGFCAEMEKRYGKDGILRSAGRTLVYLRIETACHLFSSLRDIQEILSNESLSLEEKAELIKGIHATATGGILMTRDGTDERLAVYAGLRLVRLWEQFVHIECAFIYALFSNYCTSAMFTNKLDGSIEVNELVRCLRFQLGPGEHVGAIGKFSVEMTRTLLASVTQLDRQPVLWKRSCPLQASPRYLHRLPTLLVSAMTVDAARSCLESIAFVLVAWGRPSSDTSTALTLMEAVTARVRELSPKCTSQGALGIAQVAADYIEEMIGTAQLWQLYYRVYRPVSSLAMDNAQVSDTTQQTASLHAGRGSNNNRRDGRAPVALRETAMDFLASAAEAAQGKALLGGQASSNTVAASATSSATDMLTSASPSLPVIAPSVDAQALPWDAQGLENLDPSSTASGTPASGCAGQVDPSFYDACIPFDLEAFLKDVDQLF